MKTTEPRDPIQAGVGFCEWRSKIRYPTRSSADRARAALVKAASRRRRTPTSYGVYQCAKCGDYHLTTKREGRLRRMSKWNPIVWLQRHDVTIEAPSNNHHQMHAPL